MHEYGNGAFNVHNNVVYFSNFTDQCLYTQTNGGAPVQLTENKNHRYANGVVSNTVSGQRSLRNRGGGGGLLWN